MRVCCVMMQRNEIFVLDAWIKYYGYLFGYSNLFILDNGSDNPAVIETLERCEKDGVTVYRERNTPSDYIAKGHIIGEMFTKFQKEKMYDFYFPLDCDEFIGVLRKDGVSFATKDIISELANYANSKDTIGIKYELRNSFRHKDSFYMLHCNKTAFSKGMITTLDHGFHTAGTESGTIIKSELCHIHLHNKPYSHLMEASRRKLQAFGIDTSNPDAIASAGHSYHILGYFATAKETISSNPDSLAHIRLPSFGKLLSDIGAAVSYLHGLPESEGPPITLPFDMDADGYFSRYPDVAKSGMSALIHYLLFGGREGRLMESRTAGTGATSQSRSLAAAGDLPT